jgi:hypothetical protein
VLAVRVRYAVRLVNSANALCNAEGGLLAYRCPLFVLYCRGHQYVGMSCVCKDNYLLRCCIDIYCSRTLYRGEVEELKLDGR